MQKHELEQARAWVREELFDRCIPFWMQNGMDEEYGGIFTCLDREGKRYSPDKSVWFQGRAAWVFARLCNQYGAKPEWLAAAKSCLDFLDAHCFLPDGGGRMYFTVTREGKPLRARRYHFSEMFYAIACAEYYGATGEEEYLAKARNTALLAWRLYKGEAADASGIPPKTQPETRQSIPLSEPLMFLNTVGILRRFDEGNIKEYDAICGECAATVMEKHIHHELRYVFENVAPDGTVLRELPMGRVMNPGHVIEASWFMLEEAAHRKNDALRGAAVQMFTYAHEAGWDNTYGGLLSFVDLESWPPEQIEHDMKYWWPHCEMLIASLMIARDTGDMGYLTHFKKVLEYCQTHFADPAFGEWYGYLRRDGTPTEPAPKGNMFKGPFHLPRALMALDELLGDLLEKTE